MNQLLKSIELETERITAEQQQEDKKLRFYRNFFSKNSRLTAFDLVDIDPCELAIAIMAGSDDSTDIDTIKEIVYANKIIFEKLDMNCIGDILAIIDLTMIAGIYDKITSLLQEEKLYSLKNTFSKDAKPINSIKELVSALGVSQKAFAGFMTLVQTDHNTLADSLGLVSSLREFKADIESINADYEQACEEEGARLKEKEKNKVVVDLLKEKWKLASLAKSIEDAKKYSERLESAERARQKSLNKARRAYENLAVSLPVALSGGEIRKPEDILGKVPSGDIYRRALKLIYEHNKTIHDKIATEYSELSANAAPQYRILLSKYGISPEKYNVETVMGNSLEELEKMLQQLTKLQITSPTDVLRIVSQSNLQTITNYVDLVERGIITSSFFNKHKNIFNPESKMHTDFIKNLKLLQEKKVNPHYLTSSSDAFVIPHQTLSDNINVLEEYDLIGAMKTGVNYGFLSQEGLREAIDLLLELGYEDNLEAMPELLNHKDKFSRLQVLNALNMPLSSTEDILAVLTTDKFFIPDSIIGDYIYNAVEHNLSNLAISGSTPQPDYLTVDRLDEFEATPRTYNIDGVIISKNKVLRNLNSLDTQSDATGSQILYCVIKGSTLTDEEYIKIETVITPRPAVPTKQNQ